MAPPVGAVGRVQLTCPNGHSFVATVAQEETVVLDCEVRDWERFGLLPTTTQETVLEAIQGGRIPRELLPLMTRLRNYGVVVCT